jgi:hypothetical protein
MWNAYIDVLNHAASLSSGTMLGNQPAQYFNVHSGTDAFVFCLSPSGGSVTGTLKRPDGTTALTFNASTATSYTLNSPTAGLWTVNLDSVTYEVSIGLRGIPSLIWHDPEYLLIGGD